MKYYIGDIESARYYAVQLYQTTHSSTYLGVMDALDTISPYATQIGDALKHPLISWIGLGWLSDSLSLIPRAYDTMNDVYSSRTRIVFGLLIICLTLPSISTYVPIVFCESDEWLTIENEFFIIHYHQGQEEDAEEALTCAMWVQENTLEKYPHTLSLRVTITLYSDRDEIRAKEGAYTAISHVGSSRASIGIISPSWTGSWGGYEGLDRPFRRVLNHEYVHCPFYIDLYTKSRGYKDPPSWFSQGLAEYISGNYLPSYVNRVRESVEQGSFTINEPYTWGIYIVEYMYSEYGQDKVINVIKSSAPTFNVALEKELGVAPLEFEDGWRRYIADKFGVEYPSPELANNTVIEFLKSKIDHLNNTLVELESEQAKRDELIVSLKTTVENLMERYESLNQKYGEMVGELNTSNVLLQAIQEEFDSLNSTYNILLDEYECLNSTCDMIVGELATSRILMYAFAVTTIILLFAVIYVAKRR